MERDFLAAIGKEQQHPRKEKAVAAEESAYFGTAGAAAAAAAVPAMDWSFASKPGAAPALMSFRSAAREEPSFPQFSAFDGSSKNPAPRTLTHQRSFGPDSTQYAALHRAQHALNGARAVPVSSPFSQSNPMFRVQSSPSLPNGTAFKQPPFAISNAVASSTVGSYGGTRDAVRPRTAQLTIFYAGSVNVFNNVSAEKAQELMFLASRGSLPSSAPVACKPEAPTLAPAKATAPEVLPAKQMLFQKPQHPSPPPSAVPKPVPGILPAAALPRSASSSNLDSTAQKSSVPLAVPPVSQAPPATLATTTAAAIMPRAVPQARKASLARFLEKRKERVTTAAPYPSAKSPLESSDTFGSGSANANDKSSCTDIAHSSNHEESLCLGQPRSIISFSEESPSTKLQI